MLEPYLGAVAELSRSPKKMETLLDDPCKEWLLGLNIHLHGVFKRTEEQSLTTLRTISHQIQKLSVPCFPFDLSNLREYILVNSIPTY